MQQQFPNASIELVQRYEQEQSRAHHLQAKVELQNVTVQQTTQRMEDACDAHNMRMNEVLGQSAALQAQLRELEHEEGTIDAEMSQLLKRLDEMAVQMARSRLRFAQNFLSRNRLHAPSEFDAGAVFEETDALNEMLEDEETTAMQPSHVPAGRGGSIVDSMKEAEAGVAAASPRRNERAAFVLLELARRSLEVEQAVADENLATGRILPHEYDARVADVQQEVAEMSRVVASLTVGRPLMRTRLRKLLKLPDDAERDALEETVESYRRAPGAEVDSDSESLEVHRRAEKKRPTLLRYGRPASASLGKPPTPSRVAAGAPCCPTSDSPRAASDASLHPVASPQAAAATHSPVALDVRRALRQEVDALHERLRDEHDAAKLPTYSERLEAFRQIDTAELEKSRAAAPAPCVYTSPKKRAVKAPVAPKPADSSMNVSGATLRRPRSAKLGWRSDAEQRPASASRYALAAMRCGVAPASKQAVEYDPSKDGPFRFTTHASLERALESRNERVV